VTRRSVHVRYSQGKTRVSYKAVVMVRVAGGRAEPMLMFVQYLHATYAFAVRACLQSDLATGCGDGCKHGV
jgi:hypothetical protein